MHVMDGNLAYSNGTRKFINELKLLPFFQVIRATRCSESKHTYYGTLDLVGN